MKNFTQGIQYRAFGLFIASTVAILTAIIVPDETLGFLITVIVGGGLGGYFFWLADKKGGNQPPS